MCRQSFETIEHLIMGDNMGNIILGRNNSQLITDSRGKKYIRKYLVGNLSDVKRRLGNIEKFENIRTTLPDLNSPRLSGLDKSNNFVEHEWISEGVGLNELLEEDVDRFKKYIDSSMAAIAQVNNIVFENKQANLEIGHTSPLIALSTDEFSKSTGAELELFALLQRDKLLIDSLKVHSSNAVLGYRHGDLRLDQLLIDPNGKLYIIDFEEFSLGDVHTDLAGFIGSIVFKALLDTFSKAESEVNTSEEIDNYFVHKGNENLSNMKPLIVEAIDRYTYYSDKSINLELLAVNVGWFIIERIISRSKFTYRLSNVDKAIAGVGRQSIVNPKLLVQLLG